MAQVKARSSNPAGSTGVQFAQRSGIAGYYLRVCEANGSPRLETQPYGSVLAFQVA